MIAALAFIALLLFMGYVIYRAMLFLKDIELGCNAAFRASENEEEAP